MAISKTPEGEHVFIRNSALQVPAWSQERVGDKIEKNSVRVELPAGATLIELSATHNCYINFGDVTVVAEREAIPNGSRLFMAGMFVVVVPEDADGVPFTHVAFRTADKDKFFQAEKLT